MFDCACLDAARDFRDLRGVDDHRSRLPSGLGMEVVVCSSSSSSSRNEYDYRTAAAGPPYNVNKISL